MDVEPTVDWLALRAAAQSAATRAYAPYSGLRVGAAGVTAAGVVLTGCNVENASFGLTLCAECGLVSRLFDSAEQRLVAITVLAGDGRLLMPCGRCRQLLHEVGGPQLLIDQDPVPRRLHSLLPNAFGPEHLPGASTNEVGTGL